MQALKEKEALQVKSSRLESIVAKACKIVPELHTPQDATPEAKIRKLAGGVREAKAEVGWVTLEFNVKIA